MNRQGDIIPTSWMEWFLRWDSPGSHVKLFCLGSYNKRIVQSFYNIPRTRNTLLVTNSGILTMQLSRKDDCFVKVFWMLVVCLFCNVKFTFCDRHDLEHGYLDHHIWYHRLRDITRGNRHNRGVAVDTNNNNPESRLKSHQHTQRGTEKGTA